MVKFAGSTHFKNLSFLLMPPNLVVRFVLLLLSILEFPGLHLDLETDQFLW